jgi:hypothetical protein
MRGLGWCLAAAPKAKNEPAGCSARQNVKSGPFGGALEPAELTRDAAEWNIPQSIRM